VAIDMQQSTLRLRWEADELVLDLGALQGLWTLEQYLKLTDQTNRLIEFAAGCVEVLPMPTRRHQVILALLYELFVGFLRPRGGKVLFAPLRLQVRPSTYREPDLLLLLDANDPRNQNAFWLGADLVIEIVSPDDPERDIRVKRADYAEAGIPEYWVVDARTETLEIHRAPAGEQYAERLQPVRGTTIAPVAFPDTAIPIDAIFV